MSPTFFSYDSDHLLIQVINSNLAVLCRYLFNHNFLNQFWNYILPKLLSVGIWMILGSDYLAMKPFFISYASAIILQISNEVFVWHIHYTAAYTCVAILCLQHDLGIINKCWAVKKGEWHTFSVSLQNGPRFISFFFLISRGCAHSSRPKWWAEFFITTTKEKEGAPALHTERLL